MDNPTARPRTGMARSEPSTPAASGASGGHHEPRSRLTFRCPTLPPSKSRGMKHPLGEGTMVMAQQIGALRATEADEARRTNAGSRGSPQRYPAGHDHIT